MPRNTYEHRFIDWSKWDAYSSGRVGSDAVSDDELLTTKEVADLFKVSQLTVRRWCATGVLPSIKLGHEWRISRRRLDRLIQEQLDSRFEQNGFPAHGDSAENGHHESHEPGSWRGDPATAVDT